MKMLSLILASLLFLNQAQAFGIGSLVFFDASNASISSKQYPTAQAVASKLDGRIVKIAEQTNNSHNHSKWIIQSTQSKQPITKLKVREKHLFMPEITIRDVSKLTDVDTVRLITNHTSSLSESTSKRIKFAIYFGMNHMFPHLENTTCACGTISAFGINSIIENIKYTLIAAQRQSHLTIFLDNQMDTINVSELNERIKTFAKSSVIMHATQFRNVKFHFLKDFDSYADWRPLSLSNNMDKIIVFGCTLHSHDEYDRIVPSQFVEYEMAHQLARSTQAVLTKQNQDSVEAIRQLLWIKSSWMESVYNAMKHDLKKSERVRRQIEFVRAVHKRSYAVWHAGSKKVHQLCVECDTKEEYDRLLKGDRKRLQEKEGDTLNEISSIMHDDRVELVRWIIETIQKKCAIFRKVHGLNISHWMAAMHETIKQFMMCAKEGQLDTFHVVFMKIQFEDGVLEQMQQMMAEAIEFQAGHDGHTTETVIC